MLILQNININLYILNKKKNNYLLNEYFDFLNNHR